MSGCQSLAKIRQSGSIGTAGVGAQIQAVRTQTLITTQDLLAVVEILSISGDLPQHQFAERTLSLHLP